MPFGGFRVPIESPCVAVCRLDPVNGWCKGCRRTVDEIKAWRTAGDEERREILARAAARPMAD
jgi:hypothetical protein